MLFFNPPQFYHHRRGSGRSHTGGITLWGRRGVRRWNPLGGQLPQWGILPSVGRIWSTRLATVGVTRGGLTWASPPRWATRGGYIVSTWGPLPPNSPSGWSTLLKWIPVGTSIGGLTWAVHSPGSAAKVLRHRGGLTQVRLPSGCQTWLANTVGATLGVTQLAQPPEWTRAGDAWRAGWRPHVRGTAMNPVDHPHGGGQGKTSGGRPGVTPWGRLTRGVKTARPRSSKR